MSDSSISLTPGGSGGPDRSRMTGSHQSAQPSQTPANSENGENGSKAVSKENISQEKLEESAELLNKSAEVLQRNIRFNVVPSEDVVQAEIFNQQTDEVIKKIPPDEIIELRKKIDAFIGLFVDEER